MHRTAPTHATHDELLLARLYGGDVDETERSRALDQMASCQDCADVFADLGAIAVATAALPTPPRPRDFTLTEADAARLQRRSIGGAIFDWLGRTKALGGAMVAAGLVGVVLVGAISVLGPGGGSAALDEQPVVDAPIAAGMSGSAAYDSASPALVQNGASQNGVVGAAATELGSPRAPQAASGGPSQPAGPATSGGAPQKLALSTEEPINSGEPILGPIAGGQGSYPGGPSASPFPSSGVAATSAAGPDVWELALAGFAGLAILGVLLLTVPHLAARRRA
jgi:anti-sigma factor RsiW